MSDFMECSECSKRSGTPVLCPSCLHNRRVIGKLRDINKNIRKKLDMKLDMKTCHKCLKQNICKAYHPYRRGNRLTKDDPIHEITGGPEDYEACIDGIAKALAVNCMYCDVRNKSETNTNNRVSA